MANFQKVLLCSLAASVPLAGGLPVYAAPACELFSEVTMEDGTARQVRPRGDEFFNWTEAADGFAVARAASGRWQYARREPGRWVPAGMTPQQTGREGRRADPPTHTSPFDGPAGALSLTGESASAGAPALLAATPAPAKLLVILVSFADRGFTYGTNAPSFWTDKFFGASGKTIGTYYKQASKNRFWFVPAEESQGVTNDGLVSVTLAINHPNTTAIDDTVRSAVKAALVAADPYVDYHAFDTSANGVLATSELHLVLVFAGYEASYSTALTPLVWAHRWALFTPVTAPVLDGVSVASANGGGYMAVGEIHYNHSATIGVICHELGHNLGLPDLYDTDNSSDGVGTHCLMGSGNWTKTSSDSNQGQTPVLPSAYCRQLIGFSDAVTAAGEGVAYTLKQVSDSSNVTDMVRINTQNSQQYFLVENRQLTGFDAGLSYYLGVSSGGGLAVWHIDTSMSNNDTDTRRLVDLEEAASPVLDTPGLPWGDLHNYYYAGNVTRFDETTSPSNGLNGGGASLARVYSVSAPGAQMSFTADEGVSLQVGLDVSMALPFTSGGSATWTNQTAVTHDGRDAVQSGAVSKNAATSWMQAAVTGPVQVAFWWKHAAGSSETLKFLVDGVQRAATNAAMDWARQRAVVAPGAHTLRWEFTTTRKNGSASEAYVDQLTVAPPSKGTTFSVR